MVSLVADALYAPNNVEPHTTPEPFSPKIFSSKPTNPPGNNMLPHTNLTFTTPPPTITNTQSSSTPHTGLLNCTTNLPSNMSSHTGSTLMNTPPPTISHSQLSSTPHQGLLNCREITTNPPHNILPHTEPMFTTPAPTITHTQLPNATPHPGLLNYQQIGCPSTNPPQNQPSLNMLPRVTSSLPQSIMYPRRNPQRLSNQKSTTTPIWIENGIASTTNTNYINQPARGYSNMNGYQPNTMYYGELNTNYHPRTPQLWYGDQIGYHYNHSQYEHDAARQVYCSPLQPYYTNEMQHNHHQMLPYHFLSYPPSTYQVPNFPSITRRRPANMQIEPSIDTRVTAQLPHIPLTTTSVTPGIPALTQPVTSQLNAIPQPTTEYTTTTPCYYNQPSWMQGDIAVNYMDILAGLLSQSTPTFANYHQTGNKVPCEVPSSEPRYLPSCFYDYAATNIFQFPDICTSSSHLNYGQAPNGESLKQADTPPNGSNPGYTRITLGRGMNPGRGLCAYIPKEPLSSCMYIASPHVPKSGDAESMKHEQNMKALAEVDVIGLDVPELGKDPQGGQPARSRPAPREWVCSVCGKILARKSTLKIHMRQHTGVRPFTCPTCDKTFAQAGLLQSHLRRHTGERPYTCTYCPKRFAHSGALRTHLRTHTGERPHLCPVSGCGLAFGDSSTLSKHRRTHTGERPYVCVTCGKGFTQSGNMHKHRKTVHHIFNTSLEKTSII